MPLWLDWRTEVGVRRGGDQRGSMCGQQCWGTCHVREWSHDHATPPQPATTKASIVQQD